MCHVVWLSSKSKHHHMFIPESFRWRDQNLQTVVSNLMIFDAHLSRDHFWDIICLKHFKTHSQKPCYEYLIHFFFPASNRKNPRSTTLTTGCRVGHSRAVVVSRPFIDLWHPPDVFPAAWRRSRQTNCRLAAYVYLSISVQLHTIQYYTHAIYTYIYIYIYVCVVYIHVSVWVNTWSTIIACTWVHIEWSK